MDQNQFKVIYTGRVLADHDEATVAKDFAARFKMSPEKALKVIGAGKEVTIKARAEHVKAYKLKSLLESLGMEVRLQRVNMQAAPPNLNLHKPANRKQIKHNLISQHHNQLLLAHGVWSR